MVSRKKWIVGLITVSVLMAAPVHSHSRLQRDKSDSLSLAASIIRNSFGYSAACGGVVHSNIQVSSLDSVSIPHPGVLSCDVEQIQIQCRSVNVDSMERKTTVTLLLKERSDSTHWSARLKKEKTDTVRFDPACCPAFGTVPAQKYVLRSWRRWAEPSLVLVTLSGMVYLFYSIRSK